ncbi:hypothetical protein AKL17_1p0050 (plasmid) [Frigidibacter mobilis]|uniref:Uncharacterized protein n=1 Tax=Frigidibacter mobilis TaxID=1335048 RepID=A0A159Z933_9RHOB|nr:hypothetical protein AKL17_1p0050 [Frigidibacter mobilis]
MDRPVTPWTRPPGLPLLSEERHEGAGTTAAILIAGALDPLAAFGLDPALAVVMGKLLDQVVIHMAGGNTSLQSPFRKMPRLTHAGVVGDLAVALASKPRGKAGQMRAKPGNLVRNGHMAGIPQIAKKPPDLGDISGVPQLRGAIATAPAAVSRKTTDRRSIKILDRETSVVGPLQEMSGGAERASRQVGIIRKITGNKCLAVDSPAAAPPG